MTSLFTSSSIRSLVVAAVFAALPLAMLPEAARAADAIFAPGEPVITGFPGTLAPESPPDGVDPLDLTMLDPDGKSVIIQQLQPDGGPEGQLIDTPAAFGIADKDVGLVFGVALDDANETEDAEAPNIYVAATSLFGLNLVVPGDDASAVRSKTGAPEATWMPGQWGSAGGEEGYPGSIWKIDGETGEVSLFTTIAPNSGAGLGAIVFDPASQQFFVSDLDTGLIYRLGVDGSIVDSFDHGVTARPTHELDAVEDDGSAIDITDPAFNTEDPSTWGSTQPDRRVFGLAMRNGRLYYAAEGPSIWSVKINEDGGFGTARWELDVTDLPSTNEVTSIAFDAQGRMLLAQRGTQAGSYDYYVFAEPGTSSVLRYKREFPDDPDTPSTWVSEPKSYAIGLASDGTAASGGIALGYGFNETSGNFTGACGAYLWASGDGLRNNPDLDPPVEGPMNVNGLQGMAKSAVRPLNDPPTHSFFTDYDGNTGDDTANEAGHVGALAIWQECAPPDVTVAPSPPDFDDEEDDDDYPPPDYDQPDDYNLTLEKWAKPYHCFDGGANWSCHYTIRVENTGTVPYWGPITVHDFLPANNPGAVMSFWPQPPWACGPTGPTSATCTTFALLYPGDGVVLHETIKVPKALATYCQLVNAANLQWGFLGGGDDDSSDDFDIGVAGIGAPGCPGPGGGSDLLLQKHAAPGFCFNGGADWLCTYHVTVHNTGPGNFSGPIQVKDTLGVNAVASVVGPWSCAQAGPVLTCNINVPPVNAPPGWSSGFFVTAHVPKAAPQLCDLDNKANISFPAGGSPTNSVSGNDFDSATTHVPALSCFLPKPKTDIQIKKTANTCSWLFGYYCKWTITITNVGPDNYSGPLKLTDNSALATSNNLASVMPPGCVGPPSSITCTYPLANLPSGVPFSFTFKTKYATTPSLCSATNTATVVSPNPGSPQNPSGNDSATVGHSIPNPACLGLPVLNITKTAKGCASDPSSTNWLCKFEVKVKNLGPVAQPTPIKVMDYNLKPTTFSGAVCPPSGANHWLCSKPAPLGPGATWTFTATTKVDPNGVTLADCNVDNYVWIDTPFSWDPGHFSHANQKVPQLFINPGPGPVFVYCDPPSLKLAKVAGPTVKVGDGYDSTFTITATSTGPDPYHGTVELDEDLPEGATYKSSTWPCVPTTGNDVHCSSPYKDLAVGQKTSMTITIHIPKDVAVAAKCNVLNTVNVAISAEVLHADQGAQYTASAKAKLPADACRQPPACPTNQVKPDGTCCPADTLWNGKQCAPPKPKCPDDSHLNDAGKCVCDKGTEGKPGSCTPIVVLPTCPDDSHLNSANKCVCDKGTEGKPGKCTPIPPPCADDSHINDNGKCVCDKGTEGRPGQCEPIQPSCPDDSHVNDNGRCVCDRGTEGKPGQCEPIQPSCPDDSHPNGDGQCVCDRGTEGQPGQCTPIVVKPTCPDDSHPNGDGQCVCNRGTQGDPGFCQPIPVTPQCPADSHFDKRQNGCVCNRPLIGEPGNCHAQVIIIDPVPVTPAQCPADSQFSKRAKACVCTPPLVGDPGSCHAEIILR